nr:MAG TPA: hypothetical protein [Caudoviricetes sp.]
MGISTIIYILFKDEYSCLKSALCSRTGEV